MVSKYNVLFFSRVFEAIEIARVPIAVIPDLDGTIAFGVARYPSCRGTCSCRVANHPVAAGNLPRWLSFFVFLFYELRVVFCRKILETP